MTRFRRKTYNRPAPPLNTFTDYTLGRHGIVIGGTFAYSPSIISTVHNFTATHSKATPFQISGSHGAPVTHKSAENFNIYSLHDFNTEMLQTPSWNINFGPQDSQASHHSVASVVLHSGVQPMPVKHKTVVSQNITTLHTLTTAPFVNQREDWPTLVWPSETWNNFAWGEGLFNWEPNT